ncbi:MAG TPA: Ni/Fe-hydrogenase cytochrome b subunit [Candidatus Krumholzibacteria bacterium]|nr:Ni/Fe-hydrogenase cytochrome b subunit [Candidatus Krumholzibacteria bacterium]HPD73064.1 Ni/Fe-hydrogenase cytochrome b subunit [Candidatus Krumholzibacteria bacterium]HRY41864.1 Ni/Fe-hydrogenase cytochrome b subunit [Candidatus Krumholzibacteria bacterium]
MNRTLAVPFFTPGVRVLAAIAAAGLAALVVRFTLGIGAVSNLDDQYPWGIWIAIDVATGVALAAGGFTTAFLAHVLHWEKFHSVVRPALMTAMLGYTFVALGVVVDLGRYYVMWHIALPSMWQGNSALFEVGMCVMIYLTVLYIEFLPIAVERFKGRVSFPRRLAGLNRPAEALLRGLDATLGRVMTFFIIAGVVLSCAHQSSLGTLMVIAPTKLHPLWHTTVLPLQFLLSAFAVGLAMVIFEGYLAARSLRHPFDLKVMSALGRMIPFLLTIYLAAKLIDMVNRSTYRYLDDLTLQSVTWLVEVVAGVVAPAVILMSHRLRRRAGWLFGASALVVGGVVLNRLNVFVIGYQPPFADRPYVPAWPEVLITLGMVSLLVIVYRLFVFVFPVVPEQGGARHA